MVLNYYNEKSKGILKFIERERERETGKVLDLGCNEGGIINLLKIDKNDYFGIDSDNDALIRAGKNGLRVKYVDLNKNKIPFKSNSFDTILALDVLEHLMEPERIIEEISRLLKKDGKGIISLPHDYYFINFLRMILLNKPILFENSFGKRGTHIHFFTIKLGKKIISKYFKIEKIRYFGNSISVPFFSRGVKYFLANLFPRFFAANIFMIVSNKR